LQFFDELSNDRGMVRKAVREMRRRTVSCQERNGGHIE